MISVSRLFPAGSIILIELLMPMGSGKTRNAAKPVGTPAEPHTVGDYLCRPKGEGDW